MATGAERVTQLLRSMTAAIKAEPNPTPESVSSSEGLRSDSGSEDRILLDRVDPDDDLPAPETTAPNNDLVLPGVIPVRSQARITRQMHPAAYDPTRSIAPSTPTFIQTTRTYHYQPLLPAGPMAGQYIVAGVPFPAAYRITSSNARPDRLVTMLGSPGGGPPDGRTTSSLTARPGTLVLDQGPQLAHGQSGERSRTGRASRIPIGRTSSPS